MYSEKPAFDKEDIMDEKMKEGIKLPEDQMNLSADGEINDADAESAAGGVRPIYSREEEEEFLRDPAAYDRS